MENINIYQKFEQNNPFVESEVRRMESHELHVLDRMREIAKSGDKDEQKRQFEELLKSPEYKEVNDRAMNFVNSALNRK
ncbi:hypothetical protein [Bacillus mycoides]|uniref:hypothetical protein n=1 Tax=Bacillus mycoides TaxID=1405 RepID=UPI0016431DAA|nr:hypothetical protein [Bacillus mycoides]